MKPVLKKVWHFIWVDESVLSWLVNVVLAFVIIKFLVYPGMGFALGTSHPIVAVVSGSMEHDGSFDEWWNSNALCHNQTGNREVACTQAEHYSGYGISREEFKRFRFSNGFDRGDLMLLVGSRSDSIAIGDVLVFSRSETDPVIHRVVRAWEDESTQVYYFRTKGDHNTRSYAGGNINEISIHEDRLIGRAVLRLPYLGWIKIIFVEQVLCRSDECIFKRLGRG